MSYPAVVSNLLDFIGSKEAPKGYVDFYRGVSFAPEKPLTEMTIAEVLAWQEAANPPGPGTAAAGKFQIIRPTLLDLMGREGLTGEELFDQEMQDRLAVSLLKRRGLNKWLNGDLDDDAFMNNLAAEWASLPMATGPKAGRSRYDGDGVNSALATIDDVRAVLQLDGPKVAGSPASPKSDSLRDRQAPSAAPSADPSVTAQAPSKPSVGAILASAQGQEPNVAGAPQELSESTLNDTPPSPVEGLNPVVSAPLGGSLHNPAGDPRGGGNLEVPVEQQGLVYDVTAPDYQPAQYRTDREIEAAEKEAERNAPGFFELGGLAIESEWAGSWALKQAGASGFAPDENFDFSPELFKELTENLPETHWEVLDGAVSEAHARKLAETAHRMVEAEQKLGLAGGTGAALRIGAAVLDPIAIGATIASEGALAPAIWGAKVGRVGRALRAGTVAGATNASVEGYIASQDPNRGVNDILLAGMTGLAFGGAFGYFGKTELDEQLEAAAKSVVSNRVKEANNGSVGAARATPLEQPALTAAEKQLAAAADAPRTAFGRARVDMVGYLKSSNHPIIRRLGGDLAEDGVGNADGSVLGRAASENVTHEMKVRLTKFYRTAEPAYKEWAKAKGIAWWKRGLHRDEFFEQVGRAARRDAGTWTADVNVNKVADQLRTMHADLLRFAKDKGVKGFESVAENSNYLMRVHNLKKIDDVVEEHGEEVVRRLIANSMMRGSDQLEYEDALKIATGYLKSVRGRRWQDVSLARVFDGDQQELLERMLREETDLDDAGIQRILGGVKSVGREGDGGKIGSARRRVRLDESYRLDGRGDPDLGIEDLLDNNAERLIHLYTRQVTGAGYMQDVLRKYATPNADGTGENIPSFETIISQIRETAGGMGMTRAELDEQIERLETIRKAVLGIPLNKQGRFGETLRLIRDYNFIRVMNQVGFAQLAEIGNILGHAGVKATLQHVPALRSIWRRAKDGSMDDQFLDEIEVIWGIGTDRLRRTTMNRLDDYGVYEGQSVGRLDNILQKGKAITADISMMAGVNSALQRMAARASIQRFMNMASGGRKMSAKRLASIGLSEEMGERVFRQMRDHVTREEGVLGRKVKRINIDDWTDQEAASAFVNAIDRWSRRVIQENDIGQMSKWMTTDLGKSMIQFRSFMISAWQKQTLYGIHNADWDTFVSWSTSMFFGSMAYIGQTYINSVGREDASEFLSERLSTGAIARAAFTRAGFSSIAPGIADTLLYSTGFDPVFSHARTTGLQSNLIVGNPTYDLIFDKGQKAVRGTLGAAQSDRQFSQQDARNVTGVMAFQNAMGVRNILNLITQDLPRYSE